LHWHIIPRFEGDGLEPWSRKGYKEGEMAEIGEKIRKEIL
jgi:diadenosine tetraphosphate (Ap4A) HIT family hydrolase